MNEENTKTEDKQKKKKLSLPAKIIFGLLGVIALMIIVIVCYVIHLVNLPEIIPDNPTITTTNGIDITTEAPTTDEEETTEDLSGLPTITAPTTSEGETTVKDTAVLRTEEGVYNIILLGVDPTTNLTDSMIVATINQNDNTIKLTSFMRDILVDIPGHHPDRLNTVYTNGGMNLLKQVFRESFGIELYGFVKVDYNILVDVVDALGGIELYVRAAVAEFLNTSNYIADEASRNLIPDAMQQLNGYQVVGYCRQRKIGNGYEANDFARTQRQREVLTAIYNKFRDSSLTDILGLMEKVLPLVQTDLDRLEMISMATKALGGVRNDIEQSRIPINGSYTDLSYLAPGASRPMRVIGIDFEANVEAIHEFMYGQTEE